MLLRSLLAAANGEQVLYVSPTSKAAGEAFAEVRAWRDAGLLTDNLLVNLAGRKISFLRGGGSVRFGDAEGTYQGLTLDMVVHAPVSP